MTQAGEGREVLWKARSQTFDVFVTDMHMPPLDGLELTTELRANAGYRDVQIIISSEASPAKSASGKGMRGSVAGS